MLLYRLALTSHVWHLRGRKLHLSGALAGVLLLATGTAGCGASTHPPTPTPTATPTPLPPTTSGVYVLTPHALDVLSLADGTLQRRFPYDNLAADVQGYEVTPLAVADGAAYFVTNGALSNTQTVSVPSTVVALRATDGSVLWRFSLPNTVPPNPSVLSHAVLNSVVNGIIYVVSASSASTSPSVFYALSAKDGHVLWQVPSNSYFGVAPVVDGVVYLPAGAQDGTQHLHALRATDGTQVWDFQVPTCSDLRAPVVDNGMVYVSCALNPSGVYGVRASDGTLVWHRGSLGFFVSAPVAANGLVYVSAGGCGYVEQPPCPPPFYLYAFDEQSGAVRWQTQSCSTLFNVIEGVPYCFLGGALAALDPATGAVRLRYSLPSVRRFESPTPVVASGVFYFEGDEQIFAISLATGSLLWHSPTLVEQSNPTTAIFVVPQA